jgi:MarR family transcriptional regulator for hemolysin
MANGNPRKSQTKVRTLTTTGAADDAGAGAAQPAEKRGTLPSAKPGLAPPLRLTIDVVLTARRWRSLLDDRLRPIGQSAARMEAMSVIARSPESAQIEVAKRIGIEGATFTRMLDALAADGLVERLAHPTDRRTKHIRLTAAGRIALDEIMTAAEVLRRQLLDGIDPAKLAATNEFLEILLHRMEHDMPDPADALRDAG